MTQQTDVTRIRDVIIKRYRHVIPGKTIVFVIKLIADSIKDRILDLKPVKIGKFGTFIAKFDDEKDSVYSGFYPDQEFDEILKTKFKSKKLLKIRKEKQKNKKTWVDKLE